MVDFIIIVLAIVVAQFITFVVGFTLLMNEKFTMMYMRKTMKIAEKVQDEVVDDWFDNKE